MISPVKTPRKPPSLLPFLSPSSPPPLPLLSSPAAGCFPTGSLKRLHKSVSGGESVSVQQLRHTGRPATTCSEPPGTRWSKSLSSLCQRRAGGSSAGEDARPPLCLAAEPLSTVSDTGFTRPGWIFITFHEIDNSSLQHKFQ